MKLLILDKDGTLVKPKAGEFPTHPTDQEPLEGAAAAIRHHHSRGWKIAIASNQGGIAAGHKILADTFAEMRYCMQLFPEIEEAFFCPDFEGTECWRTWPESGSCHLYGHGSYTVADLDIGGQFRKPDPGMLLLAKHVHAADEVWFIGDRPEDAEAADRAGVNFMDAVEWRKLWIDITETCLNLAKFEAQIKPTARTFKNDG